MGLDLTHVGITVSDLEASVMFYEEVFGFKCRNKTTFSEQFFAAAPNLYKLSGATANVAFMVSPNGITLEMFQFTPSLPGIGQSIWNRPAYTHIALTVDDLPEFAKHMREKNVRFCMDVLDRFDGGHWVFVLDPDDNMIEIGEPMRKK